MAILTINDFSNGRYKIPVNPTQEIDLTDKITYVEGYYLPRLLGVELYNLFIADLAAPVAGEPTDPRFVKIFNPFYYQESGDCEILVQSKGIKEMLKGMVYYLYTRDEVSRITTVGIKKTDSENSQNVSAIKHDITSRWNQSIETYKAIQYYICNADDFEYDEFQGVNEPFNHPF